jgi:hypothetical protein
MNLIAVTDIFGKTKAFDKIINEISDRFDEVDIVDPYEKRDLGFQDESEAYIYFQKYVGLEKYIELLSNKLKSQEDTSQFLLGFSVGASSIWAVSETLSTFAKTKAVCFYSSQIRKYLSVIPRVAIDLYFSKHEPNYDVDEIVEIVSKKPNVHCYKTNFKHGFMNELSCNYSQEGYSKYMKIMKYV